METLIYEIKSEDDPCLANAARILREGGTVIFPTETVYGLGANALSAEAVRRIYVAKGRPSDNPIIIHIAQWAQIYDVTSSVSAEAEKLAAAFWPGPLTLILPKNDTVPDTVTGGLNTVAVRLPEHPIARKLITLSGVPVAAPSANLSGKPSPTSAAHVLQDMAGRVDCILCGGDSSGGVESTVVDLTVSPAVILRPGGVTLEQLMQVVPDIRLDPALTDHREELVPKSPGMKYAHYAPNAPMTVFVGPPENVAERLLAEARKAMAEGLRVVVLATSEKGSSYRDAGILFFDLGSSEKPAEAAKLLFQRLRECNGLEAELILAEGVPEEGIGRAVMNRMRKAAGNHVVKV